MPRICLLSLLLLSGLLKSQDLNFLNETTFTWPDHKKNYELIPDSLKNSDAVILSDDLELNFAARFMKRRQAVKILNEAGLSYFRSISLPQNFDITQVHPALYKQGRFSSRTIPFINEYKIKYFAVRIIRNKTIYETAADVKTNKVYWIHKDGERIADYEYRFITESLQVGDIVEYIYKAEINGSYGSSQFFINDYYPKLNMHISLTVSSYTEQSAQNTVIIHNIDSSLYTKVRSASATQTYYSYQFKFNKALAAVKYGQNCLAGNKLPHLTASVNSLDRHYLSGTMHNTKYLYSPKYTWFLVPDSLLLKEKIYNKYGADMRKFISRFSVNAPDSTHTLFFDQICDTLNSFKYLSSEQVHYSKEAQYANTSSSKLLKRQLDQEFIEDIYTNILFEKNVFYYKANVQDRRLGGHSSLHRAHKDYELEFFALPVKSSYRFYIPRFNGMKYMPDELPFYYEGSLCALIPRNTNTIPYREGLQNLSFIKTPYSTFNENVRTENAVYTVQVDSGIIRASIKENLNGQFSTVLRPYYNNEYIDSTINTRYYKKCTDKPNAEGSNIKLVSFSKRFPFRASYNCTEMIRFTKNEIDLSEWFSFILDKRDFKEAITQDYVFDFTFTDTYNCLFEFTKPVSIANMDAFNKTLNNEFFEITTALTKQSEQKYLLTVYTKVKQYILPVQQSDVLSVYLSMMNEINSFTLKFNQ